MSWNLPTGEAFLPHVSVASLKKQAANESNAKTRVRLLAAAHRKQSHTLEETADAFGMPKSTVQGILYRIRDKGVHGAHAVKQTGRPSQLKCKQRTRLRTRLLATPRVSGFKEDFWTTRMILAFVKREYGVTYTSEHMTRLLDKLGFSYKKPRATNPRRASDEELAEFKKKQVARCWLPDAKAASPSLKTKARSR